MGDSLLTFMPVITSTATALNTEHLLSVADDDIEFLEELWECFVEEFESSRNTLETACEKTDKQEAVLNSHNIKSGSANLGAEKMREICAGLELASKKEDFQTVLDSLGSLDDAFAELSSTFTSWIESMK